MRTILVAAAVALLSLSADARRVTGQAVRGPLDAVDSSSDASGRFRIVIREVPSGTREDLLLDAQGLDTARDGSGNLPSYHVFLVTADGNTEGDFGEAYLAYRGRARLRFANPRMEFPEGVNSLKDFEGGTLELRRDGEAVLSGSIPSFVDMGDENGSGSGAAAWITGSSRLRATRAGGRALGRVEATTSNRPRGEFEALRVEGLGLGRRGDAFTVVAIDGDRNETTLGTMTIRSVYGAGMLDLSTRRGDEIPGGGVVALAGFTVEVRDARGTAWLTGEFPILENP